MLPEFAFVYELLAGRPHTVTLAKQLKNALGLKERRSRSLAKNQSSLSEEQISTVIDHVIETLAEGR